MKWSTFPKTRYVKYPATSIPGNGSDATMTSVLTASSSCGPRGPPPPPPPTRMSPIPPSMSPALCRSTTTLTSMLSPDLGRPCLSSRTPSSSLLQVTASLEDDRVYKLDCIVIAKLFPTLKRASLLLKPTCVSATIVAFISLHIKISIDQID